MDIFKTAEIGSKIEKKVYDERVLKLREQLLRSQLRLRKADFPVIIVFSGDDRIGISETLSVLYEWMNALFLETSVLDEPTDEEKERPGFWRFWRNLPANGHISIIFGSWYRRIIRKSLHKELDKPHFDISLARINNFEKELSDDGALILKFWFHLKKSEMKKRLKEAGKDRQASWLSMRDEENILRMYDRGQALIGRVLRVTSTAQAPWRIIEGTDSRYRNLTVGETILAELTKKLDASLHVRLPARTRRVAVAKKEETKSILDTLDLSKDIPSVKYEEQLARYQSRLNLLFRKASEKKLSSILVFEGWDAAGKGGIIRRVVKTIDARQYRIIPIGVPTDEELSHHYLWRFWRHLPRAGRLTVFDRSWYGRVLVERVEGFAQEEEWRRAYQEINDFEEQLCDHNILLLKFWIHISKSEQLRRFKDREKTPYKRYKITAEDWRNRAKWKDYEIAANEMVARTSTDYASWSLVEADSKRYARIKVLKTFCEQLEKRL